jgi:threonine/homoserine/homoserine lactone efflux protein
MGGRRPMATPSNRPAADGSPGAEPAENGRRRGKPLTFLQAALFQWVNPKAWIVSVSAVATFTGSGGAFGMRTVLLPLIFLIVTVPLLILWTLTGVGAARLLRTPRQLQIFNYAMALLLVLSLIPQFLGE